VSIEAHCSVYMDREDLVGVSPPSVDFLTMIVRRRDNRDSAGVGWQYEDFR
jgi:hypothetical protein